MFIKSLRILLLFYLVFLIYLSLFIFLLLLYFSIYSLYFMFYVCFSKLNAFYFVGKGTKIWEYLFCCH